MAIPTRHMRSGQEGINNLRIGLYLFVYYLPLFTTVAGLGDSTVNRGHEHQRAIRRCSAREGRPHRFGGDQ